MYKLELKSSHEVIETINVADAESIFYCKPTDPDILTVLMKDGKRLYCDEVCPVDSLQEEPKECMYSKGNYTDEDRKVLCDGCQEECKFKPVEWSEEDDSILKEIIDSVTACDATTGTISVCFKKHEAKVKWLKSLKERFNK